MNTKLLNVVSLDGGVIIKKGASGGGGGNTPGGGGDTPTPDMPVIGDGKTYLYIKIAEKGRMNVPLYFSQTVANGVTIDWGDGSATQTLSGTGNRNTTHTYADVGEYVISLNPADGCTLILGTDYSTTCVMGSTRGGGKVYSNMLQAVEIGKSVPRIVGYTFSNCSSLANVVIPESVTSIGSSAFQYCESLANVVIPESVTSIGSTVFQDCNSLASVVILGRVTSIGSMAFYNCSSLTSVVIPESVTEIGDEAFYYCESLANVVIPESVTSIGSKAFQYCYGMAFYDFRASRSVPKLSYASTFNSIPSDCKIVVPDSLYDTWIAATNWSTHASKIVKASEFNG